MLKRLIKQAEREFTPQEFFNMKQTIKSVKNDTDGQNKIFNLCELLTKKDQKDIYVKKLWKEIYGVFFKLNLKDLVTFQPYLDFILSNKYNSFVENSSDNYLDFFDSKSEKFNFSKVMDFIDKISRENISEEQAIEIVKNIEGIATYDTTRSLINAILRSLNADVGDNFINYIQNYLLTDKFIDVNAIAKKRVLPIDLLKKLIDSGRIDLNIACRYQPLTEKIIEEYKDEILKNSNNFSLLCCDNPNIRFTEDFIVKNIHCFFEKNTDAYNYFASHKLSDKAVDEIFEKNKDNDTFIQDFLGWVPITQNIRKKYFENMKGIKNKKKFWEHISFNPYIDISFINKNYKNIDIGSIYYTNENLDENFIEQHISEMSPSDLAEVTKNIDFSESFILKYQKLLDWGIVSEYQNLSPSFILKYCLDKVNLNNLYKNKKINQNELKRKKVYKILLDYKG